MSKEEYNIFDEFKSAEVTKNISVDLKNIMLICNPIAPKGNQ